MSSGDFSKPVTTDAKADVLSNIRNLMDSLAKMQDATSDTNPPTNSIRFNSTTKRFEKYDGASWGELIVKASDNYDISVTALNGTADTGFAAAAHVGSGGAAHADVTTSVDGFMIAADKQKLDDATSAATASKLVERDASGRAQFAAPSAAADVVIKSYLGTVATLNTGTGSGNVPLVGTVSASETLAGTVERATDAEALTGTDTTRFVTAKHITDRQKAVLLARERQTNGTNGGTFTSGSWATRTLQTTEQNGISGASLATNQITLPKGEYYIRAHAPAYQVNAHKIRLYNVTDAAVLVNGTSAHSAATDATQTDSCLEFYWSISTTKVFQLEHRCQTTKATNGLGVSSNFGGDEVYSSVEVTKLGEV